MNFFIYMNNELRKLIMNMIKYKTKQICLDKAWIFGPIYLEKNNKKTLEHKLFLNIA